MFKIGPGQMGAIAEDDDFEDEACRSDGTQSVLGPVVLSASIPIASVQNPAPVDG